MRKVLDDGCLCIIKIPLQPVLLDLQIFYYFYLLWSFFLFFFCASIFLSIYLIFFFPLPWFYDFSLDAYLISPARRRQCSSTLNTYHASTWSHLIFIRYHNITLVVSGIPMNTPIHYVLRMHHRRPPMPPNIYFHHPHPSSHSQHIIYFSSVDLIWSGFDLILSWFFFAFFSGFCPSRFFLHTQHTYIDISYRSE
jgi:hypothetical protein